MARRTLVLGGVAAACVLVVIVALAVAAFGNNDYKYHLTNVTGSQPDLKLFGANNGNGETRRAQDYAGRIVVLYMGYTHCPDICPTTLAKLHAVLEKLGDDAASRVQVLFETVDPERDSLADMKQYARTFDERFRGLRLTGDALKKLEDRYHISVSYGAPDANGDYTVNHSAGIFVFDGNSEMRLIGSRNDLLSAWVEDLGHLAAQTH